MGERDRQGGGEERDWWEEIIREVDLIMETEKSTISHLQAVGLGLPVTWLITFTGSGEPVWPPVQDLEFRDQKVLMLRSGMQEHQRKRLAWVPFFVGPY